MRPPDTRSYKGYLYFCQVHNKQAYTRAEAKRRIRIIRSSGMRRYRCDANPDAFHIGHLPKDVRTGRKTAAEIYGTTTDPRPRNSGR